MTEQEKAEAEKKALFYDPHDGNLDLEVDEIDGEQEEPCDFGFSEDCVEPSLRNTNCCFECWLYTEVDTETQKQAKREEASINNK